MSNGNTQNRTLDLNVPTYLPLSDAAKKFDISEKSLTQLIQAGKIEAAQLPSGEVLVATSNELETSKTKDEIIAEKFVHLRGRTISASEASRKYSEKYGISISNQLFSRWGKAGYISVLKRGYRLQLDEAEVAYCADIYAKKYKEYNGRMSGVSIFDKNGDPYRLKYPEVAKQMRTERHLARQQSKQ